MSPTLECRYPDAAIRGDATRAGVGLAVTLPPLALAPMAPAVTAAFAAGAALFAWYGLRTLWRRGLRLEVTDAGVSIHPPWWTPTLLAWDRLDRFELRRYAVGATPEARERAGWTELRLGTTDGVGLRVESTLIGFDLLVARAAAAAAKRGVARSAATAVNPEGIPA